MAEKLHGVVPPLVVPIKDGKLDIPSLERTINRQIDAGVNGIFTLGSSGEVVFSTTARRAEILGETMRIVDGRVPVLAGVVDTETDRVIDNIHQAESYGVDGVVATAPFYALQDPSDIERHFRALRAATDLPIWAYDLPVSVHVKLSPEMLVTLGKEGVINGVKDSSGDDVSFRWLVRLNEAAGHPLQLFTGHEVVVDGAYLSGADGSVPGLGNVDPEGYVRMYKAYREGDWATVKAEQDRLADLMTMVQVSGVTGFGSGVGAFKTALRAIGVFDSNEMPTPVAALEGENVAWVESKVREAGLIS